MEFGAGCPGFALLLGFLVDCVVVKRDEARTSGANTDCISSVVLRASGYINRHTRNIREGSLFNCEAIHACEIKVSTMLGPRVRDRITHLGR